MQSQLIAITHLTTIRRNAEGKFKEASDCFCNVRLRPDRLLIGDRWDLYSIVRFAADGLWVAGAICVTQRRWPSLPNRKQLLPSRRLIDLLKSQHREKPNDCSTLSLWGSSFKCNAPESNVSVERNDSQCPKKDSLMSCVRSNEKTAKHRISVWFFFQIHPRINQLPSCPASSLPSFLLSLHFISLTFLSSVSRYLLLTWWASIPTPFYCLSRHTKMFLVSFLLYLVESLSSERW